MTKFLGNEKDPNHASNVNNKCYKQTQNVGMSDEPKNLLFKQPS